MSATMLFALFLILPFRVLDVFSGFTFTDIEDFTPLLSLIIGVIAAIFICRSTQKKPSIAVVALMGLLSLWPILPNIALYFMARQLQSKYGAWPQVMIDDPKNIYGHVTPLYDGLFHLTAYLEAFSGAWMIVFFTLFLGMKSRFTLAQRKLLIWLMIIMIIIFLIDPGHLYAWWLD